MVMIMLMVGRGRSLVSGLDGLVLDGFGDVVDESNSPLASQEDIRARFVDLETLLELGDYFLDVLLVVSKYDTIIYINWQVDS